MADFPSLTNLGLPGCTELSDVSSLVSAPRLRDVNLHEARHLRDLGPLAELLDLPSLTIHDAPLTGGLAAVIPVLDRLKSLWVFRVPTATSLQALAGNKLDDLNLAHCPISHLEPLGTLQFLTCVWLQRLPTSPGRERSHGWCESGQAEVVSQSAFARRRDDQGARPGRRGGAIRCR